MNATPAQSRLAENEVMFRQFNESVEKRFKEWRKIAEEDGQESLVTVTDEPLQFYCECADENCTQRIILKPSQYKKIHQKRNRFIIIPDHNISSVEKIVAKEDTFWTVEKFIDTPESADTLHETDVDNT